MSRPSDRTIALAFMAHPDDAGFLCAGTLIRLADLGWETHIATMTAGDCGTMTETPWAIAALGELKKLGKLPPLLVDGTGAWVNEYLASMKRHVTMRGREIGTAAAEAFVQHRGHAYPKDDILAEIDKEP